MLPVDITSNPSLASNDKTEAVIVEQSNKTDDKKDFSLLDIKPLWVIEKEAITQAIEACDGNIPKAAAMLDVSPSTIYRKKQSWDN